VLKPDALLAAWAYGNQRAADEEVDRRFHHFSEGTLKPYWPKQIDLIWNEYRDLPFPFTGISDVPRLSLTVHWNFSEFFGYLLTWSGTQRFLADKGQSSLEPIHDDLAEAWGDPQRKLQFEAPLLLRAGYRAG
jgi:hypothetical protein